MPARYPCTCTPLRRGATRSNILIVMRRTTTPKTMRLEQFAQQLGVSRATIYRMSPELQPRTIKLRSARLVVESVADYLRRVEQQQRQAA